MAGTPTTSSAPSARAMRVFVIIAVVAVLAMAALVAWAVWTAGRAPQAPPAPRFDRYESAWSSAMRKAGVEATFPPEPVSFAELAYSGRHSFEATFTAEEISALLSVYRHTVKMQGAEVEVGSADMTFPGAGQVELNGSLVTGGSAYNAQATAGVTYSMGNIRTSGLKTLVVEGFTVKGARKRQAQRLLLEYFNRYLDAAPGLSVDSAEVVAGGVHVRGFAPESLENLAP